jgi:GNAT superfamily N-acetyltransferase
MNYTIIPTAQEDDAVRRAIVAPLLQYNATQIGPSDYLPLIVPLRDQSGQVHGGLWGHTAHGWLFVQYLVVVQELRGVGLGTQLMFAAEREAFRRGCHSAWLDTMEFQAKPFYEKLGYVLFGELRDYPPPFGRYFFHKRLTGDDAGL